MLQSGGRRDGRGENGGTSPHRRRRSSATVETKRRTPAVSRQARDGDGEQNGRLARDPARLVVQDAERPLTVGDVGRGIASAPSIAVACAVLRRRARNGRLLVEGMFDQALVIDVFWYR